MGKFEKAILAFKYSKNVTVNGRNTINKVRNFLEFLYFMIGEVINATENIE